VALQPVHLVGVSVHVIKVTSQGPCGEHVHQLKMFAISQYLVKLVIKTCNFSLFFRQTAFSWLPVCTQIVLRRIKRHHSRMKRMSSLNT